MADLPEFLPADSFAKAGDQWENHRNDSGTKKTIELSPLERATMHLQASIRSNGTDEESFDRAEREWQALREWAEQEGLVLPGDFPKPEAQGGREHDVRFDDSTKLGWKYTKENLAGYSLDWSEKDEPFLHNALPLDYLTRLCLHNILFADEVSLMGLWETSKWNYSIITTQPGIEGREATYSEIEQGMIAWGYDMSCCHGRGLDTQNRWLFDYVSGRSGIYIQRMWS